MNDKSADSDDALRRMKNQVQEALVHSSEENAAPPPESADRQIIISETMIQTVDAIGTVDGLPPPTREESIEEARKILRWLRNMEFADKSVEQWLDNSSPKVVAAKKEALQRLLRIIAVHIHAARMRGLNENDPNIENAIDAIKAIALTAAEHTFNMLLTHDAKLDKLEAMIDAMDERAMLRQEQSLAQLLDTIELGMERATGQEVSELSAASRLLLASDQIQKTAYQLHSVDTMEAPTREESIELARDIIRKMQNMSFGTSSIKELIETGTAEDKAAFAQAVVEMAGLYRNLMSEAAAINPNIMQDKQVQQANDAVGQFAHSVKLMAAKEIPSSAAATQQIAADIAQMPEKWGDLHNRTVDRLMKSAEEGLEKAMEEIAQQQEQQQEEEQAQEAIESALQQSDATKRRKKKRRGDSKPRSGKSGGGGGKKSRKQHQLETNQDEAYVKQRFDVDAKMARVGSDVAAPMPGLDATALAAIRAIGGDLQNINNQLKDLATTVSNVSINDKITPDGKSTTQQMIDKELQKGPRGNNGPRV